jgi:predicted DCC family thiol-disulfide oxidoreductase YuxK
MRRAWSSVQRSSFSTGTPLRLFSENINVLYDSKCALCRIEVDYLRKKDTDGKIRFTDIEDPCYNESDPRNGGISYLDAMSKLRAVTYKGDTLTGVEVIRAMYTEVNLGWLYSFTKVPGIRLVVDRAYEVWAKYRTVVTRGETMGSILAKRNETIIKCSDQRCLTKF